MLRLNVRYSKGQLKIQEMAFVIVAIILFFVIAGIFFINIWGTGVKQDVNKQRAEKASEIALKLADSPELKWSASTASCDNCIDFDKALALKGRISSGSAYKDFWGNDIGGIRIQMVYPLKNGECTNHNYPNCKTLTLFNKSEEFSYSGNYVSVCRHEKENGGYFRCDLGKIEVSSEDIK